MFKLIIDKNNENINPLHIDTIDKDTYQKRFQSLRDAENFVCEYVKVNQSLFLSTFSSYDRSTIISKCGIIVSK